MQRSKCYLATVCHEEILPGARSTVKGHRPSDTQGVLYFTRLTSFGGTGNGNLHRKTRACCRAQWSDACVASAMAISAAGSLSMVTIAPPGAGLWCIAYPRRNGEPDGAQYAPSGEIYIV